MPERVLVTGATGFIGRTLVERLNAGGGRTGDAGPILVRAALRTSQPLPLAGEAVVVGDISRSTAWASALDGIGCVFHIAGRAHSPDRSETTYSLHRSVNVDGTLRLAEECARLGAKRLVYISTIKVMGDVAPEDRPFSEASPFKSEALCDPYTRSKIEAERGLMQIAEHSKLEVAIVRPPLVYGRGAKANLAALVRAVRLGIPLPLGAVHNRRSLVGVENLVDLLVLCGQHAAAADQVFLASDAQPVSTPALIRAIADAVGRPARLVSVPPRALRALMTLAGRSDLAERLIDSLVVDSSKATAVLGWRPRLTLKQGLRGAFA